MNWQLDDSRPIWPQLKDKLVRDILSGKYETGGPFPTVRDLAQEATVNRNTMQRALGELENEGFVITNRTAGRTVTTDQELLERTRKKLAADTIQRFLDEMEKLGFDRQMAMAQMREEMQK